MNPAIRENTRRGCGTIRGACVLVCAFVSTTLASVAIAGAEPPQGAIVAWGCGNPYFNYGQCNVPAPNTGFIGVAASDFHSLGLKADGSVVAWGCGYPYDNGQCNVPALNTVRYVSWQTAPFSK